MVNDNDVVLHQHVAIDPICIRLLHIYIALSTDDTLPYNIDRIKPYNEAKYNVVFSVTDAVLLEAIDPLSLVMQRTEGAVLSQHQSRGRGLLIQTTARFPFHEGYHHTRHRKNENVKQNYC